MTIGSSSDGYTCNRCGQWVYLDTAHVCPNPYKAIWQYPQQEDKADTIINLLNRIIQLLEKGL